MGSFNHHKMNLTISCDVIFTVCSHAFILFWLRTSSMCVETYQLSFHVFICASHSEISSFFQIEFLLFIPILVLPILWVFHPLHSFPLPVSQPSWWYFSKTLMWCRLYLVFTYIYPLLIEKDIRESWNIPIKCSLLV